MYRVRARVITGMRLPLRYRRHRDAAVYHTHTQHTKNSPLASATQRFLCVNAAHYSLLPRVHSTLLWIRSVGAQHNRTRHRDQQQKKNKNPTRSGWDDAIAFHLGVCMWISRLGGCKNGCADGAHIQAASLNRMLCISISTGIHAFLYGENTR